MEVGTIYKQFNAELLRYLKRKVRSAEDAEDILQNVFIKITSGIDKLSEDVKLRSWIFTITRNSIIDYYRVNANKKNVITSEEINEDIPELDNDDSTKGLDQCMSSMISLLPEEYREIIIESEINGVKQKDLAEKYGIAYPSMRSKIQRGRDRLKQLFLNCCHIATDVRGNIIDAQGKENCGGPCNPCSNIGES
jgi:RNA polymerase sigma-70 factor, ECF subfamily